MDDLIARPIRVTRQEAPFCSAASFDRDSANAFQLHVSESLAFAVKRAGFLYGRVDAETKEVLVDFIYEPPQQGSSDVVHLMRDADEEARVDAIADGLGMRRVGFVFTQAVGRKASETGEYTLSNSEVVQAAQLQAEGGIPEWVTAVVKLEVGEDGSADVHFEAFQMSEVCVKLFKDGVLETEIQDSDDPRLSKMRKEVIAGGKDTMEVDNDFFLVPVKISDHQGPLSMGFPIENRGIPLPANALRSHMDRAKHLPFVKRISDFHLLLQIAAFLDVKADVPTLAACVGHQAEVPEGYRLLIDALAACSQYHLMCDLYECLRCVSYLSSDTNGKMGLRGEHDGMYIDYMATGDENTSSRGTNASKYSTSKKSLTGSDTGTSNHAPMSELLASCDDTVLVLAGAASRWTTGATSTVFTSTPLSISSFLVRQDSSLLCEITPRQKALRIGPMYLS
uniref:Uncharacterized protein n=1 Tax=Aegilops tauschii TaxID=37682 RepID=N1QVP0_AEGTA